MFTGAEKILGALIVVLAAVSIVIAFIPDGLLHLV